MCDDIFDFNGNGESDIGDLFLEMELVNGDDESDEDEADFEDKTDYLGTDEDEDEIEDIDTESYDNYSDNSLDDENCDDKDENSKHVKANLYPEAMTIPITISFGCSDTDDAEEIKETDYPNKRQYRAAYALANEFSFCYDNDDKRQKACCEFILNNADKILAANYLTYDSGFLYSQAVKDNFKLPVTLPDEDEESDFELINILQKIEKRNIPLALEVWVWCLEQFLPYAQYTASAQGDMTNWILLCLYDFSDKFKTALVRYMGENPNFRKTVTGGTEDATDGIIELMGIALEKSLFDTAKDLFQDGLAIANGKWKSINQLIEAAISYSKTYKELETIEYVEQEFLPIVKSYRDGMIQDEIPLWEKDIAGYKLEMEQECEKYAYTRRNSWRMTVPDGKKYNLDPVDYDTEKEYLDALNEEKYGWRSWYKNRDTCGLNTEDYETNDEFLKDLSLKKDEKRKEEIEKRIKEHEEKHKKELEKANVPTIEDDTNIYIYCGVCFPFTSRPYSFRTNDTSIKIGDTVVAPLGEDGNETTGTVVSVGQYTRIGVPYPVERTKFILRKIEEHLALSKKICPCCGSKETSPILWGLPAYSEKMQRQLDNRELVLGGCCVTDNDPKYHCFSCNKDFGKSTQEYEMDTSEVHFEIGGFHEGYHKICVLKSDNKMKVVYTKPFQDGTETDLSFEQWDKFVQNLYRSNILDWNKRYCNNDILDGTQWSLKVKYSIHDTIEIMGSNEFPPHWKKLLNTFKLLLKE